MDTASTTVPPSPRKVFVFEIKMSEKKQCIRCGNLKHKEDFNNYKRSPDGLRCYCRSCEKEMKREYYIKNKDKISQSSKESYQKHRTKILERAKKYRDENRDKINQSKREHYQKHKLRLNAQSRKYHREHKEKVFKTRQAYYHKNREQIIENAKSYAQENRERINQRVRNNRKKYPYKKLAAEHKNRAKRRKAPGCFTNPEWKSLCSFYNNTCLCCGTHANDTPEGKLSPDHIIPISKGGSNDISNIQPLCAKCNHIKSDRTIDYRDDYVPWKQLSLFDFSSLDSTSSI